jgi:hypothetical protein
MEAQERRAPGRKTMAGPSRCVQSKTVASLWSGSTKDKVGVNLEILHITPTYLGVLEGIQTTEHNDEIIESAIKAATRLVLSAPVFVIPPTRTVHHPPASFSVARRRRSYERLPAFQCLGHFGAHTTRDPEYHGSSLTLVWFQTSLEAFRVPLDVVDWWAHARDFIY